jgi:ABC-2 type transport system permease protein
MSRIRTLIRAGLKSNFGFAVLYHRIFREKKDRWLVPIFILAFAGVLPLLYGLLSLIRNGYHLLKPMGQERALLAVGVLSGQILILTFGIYYVISAFYFSRDLDFLIPLPVRPFEVMLTKFTVILVNEYLSVAFIVLPFLIVFGVMDGSTIGYWINALLVYFALPVLPLAVISALVVAMMRLINVTRKKDILILVGSIALLVAGLGFPILVQHFENSEINALNVAALLSSPDGLVARIGTWFPPSIWATKAIAGGFSGEGLSNLLMFLGTSLLFFGAMAVMAERLFYGSVIGLAETAGRRRALTRDEMTRRVSPGRSPVTAIFIREWRIMNRTPVFLLNGVVVVVVIPAFFVFMSRSGSMVLGSLLMSFVESGYSVYLILSSALFMTISGCINGTASSTFSREGAQFWMSRVIPVSPHKQAAAKFLHSYIMGSLGVIAASAAVYAILRLRLSLLLVSLGLALIANLLITAVGMIIDLARPYLDWTNPQKAIKQNLNVLLALFADLGILTAAYFGVKMLIRFNVAGNLIIVTLYSAFAGFAALAFRALLKFADKRYGEIEI